MNNKDWFAPQSKEFVAKVEKYLEGMSGKDIQSKIESLAVESHRIHDIDGINLNPATNILNPRAEKLLASGMGSRASLGHPGDKYEVGLDAIEEIEVIANDLACKLFNAQYSEYRVGSGALANLYSFMATTKPGDTIIAPPATIGGHVTHHKAGAAGLYGLQTISAPIDEANYTIDIDELNKLAKSVKPKLITIGGSLNLFPHPIAKIREIADEVGAYLLFDAAHLCGMIAGKKWPQPLAEGAHLMSFSTYKSLGGPAGGLIVTNDKALAEKLDAIAYPGLTANFDAAKTAALAITLQDWISCGTDYAEQMIATAQALAHELDKKGLDIFGADKGFTTSHQFAIRANKFGGGQTASKKLAKSGLLACGINIPGEVVAGDNNAVRIGTPEIVRIGMKVSDMPKLADLIYRGLTEDNFEQIKVDVKNFRKNFSGVHYTLDLPN